MTTIKEGTIKKLEKLWKLVINNPAYVDMMRRDATRPCMFLYRFPSFLEKEGEQIKCSYFVADKGSPPWISLLSYSPEVHQINSTFQHDKHLLICLSLIDENEDVMKFKIFDKDTLKEIKL